MHLDVEGRTGNPTVCSVQVILLHDVTVMTVFILVSPLIVVCTSLLSKRMVRSISFVLSGIIGMGSGKLCNIYSPQVKLSNALMNFLSFYSIGFRTLKPSA